MKLYDQHIHSNFSVDSKEDIENYIIESKGRNIVTTEHLDLKNPQFNFEDVLIYYEAYDKKINKLNDKYSNKIYKGIEIGYVQGQEKDILNYLDDKHFNLKLLSLHHDGKIEFYEGLKTGLSIKKYIQYYYNLMIEALESPIKANILSHFEYAIRYYNDIGVSELKDHGDSYLDKICDLLIDKDMALELNTKSMYKFNKIQIYEYMIDKYISRGGRLFSLGSDAHVKDDYMFSFDKAEHLLKSKGINQIATFIDDKITMVKI